jgi:hypothetical protein
MVNADPFHYFVFSSRIKDKLEEKHDVTKVEVKECFVNSTKKHIVDTREKHRTSPPTLWFITETYAGRLLKVCYIYDETTNEVFIKTAYEPNSIEIQIYEERS